MNQSIFFCLFFLSLYAQSPQYIEHELSRNETQFRHAKEMFNPWYAGPLLTGGASMMAPGNIGIQPYFFVADNYAQYNSNRKAKSIDDLVQFNSSTILQAGITPWMDVILSVDAISSWQEGRQSGGLGDTNLILGFPIWKETLNIPNMKVSVGAVMPTGRYRDFTPSKAGVQATGGGSWQPQFIFAISKVLLYNTLHPMNLRSTFTYTIPTSVFVTGFNSYGGGFGTCGTVRPGRQFNVSTGIDWSFTERWAFANDFVYVYNNRSHFSGRRGVNADGAPASVRIPSNGQFSLAPAIQYNPTPMLGFVAGTWFTVTGRNSLAFVQGVITVTYAWSVR